MTPVFDKNLHSYVDVLDNFKYESVTQWVSRFKKPFDAQKMAKRVATRRNISVEQVLQEWDQKRDNSTDFGSKIHKALEHYFTEKKIDETNRTIIENFHQLNIDFNLKHTSFEKIVFDKRTRIAGTSDVIEDVGKHMFNVYDFKTNKNFRINTKYDEFMLSPIEHLPSTEYFIYAMQLSMYAYLYNKMTGRCVSSLRVLWYNRKNAEDYADLQGSWKIFNLPYLHTEIEACLEYMRRSEF